MILNLTVFFYFAPAGDGADSCLQYIRNASDDAIMGLHGDSHWRRGINIYKVINVRHRTDDQPQRAPRAQSGVVYLCVLCELCGFSSQLTGGCMGIAETPGLWNYI